MKRRQFLTGGAAAVALLSAPAVRAQSARTLRFIPHTDLAVIDPLFSNTIIARNHAYLVYDFLYGLDASGRPQPQMAAGHTISDDRRTWTIKLRDGLRFHDGTPVLARDVIASLRRWATRDIYARSVFEGIDELKPLDDATMQFKLKRPFRLLPDLFAKLSPYPPTIMPERLASMPATKPLTEIVGSGPFRYLANERVPGSFNAYERFAEYRPVAGGEPSGLAGPKVVHFDRIEWHTIPDAGTAAAALQSGEIDWWEETTVDLMPLLRSRNNLRVDVINPAGYMAVLRFNHINPPFNNPAIRRALLGAFKQSDVLDAVVGNTPQLRMDNVGFFHPDSPYANRAGMEALAPRDLSAVKASLAAAGYNGELVRLIVPLDLPGPLAESEVVADVMRRLGMNLDYVGIDWGAAIARLFSRNPIDKGGWSATCNFAIGPVTMDQSANGYLRATGQTAIFGWPESPKLEALRTAWIDSEDMEERKRLSEDFQRQCFQDLPYIPLGGYRLPAAYRRDLTGIVRSPIPVFWNVRRA